MYTDLVYIKENGNDSSEISASSTRKQNLMAYILAGTMVYAAIYEFIQVIMNGFDYFTDTGNYIDILYIYGTVSLFYVHNNYTPYIWYSKILIIAIVILCIR
jgi:hypothetical protein